MKYNIIFSQSVCSDCVDADMPDKFYSFSGHEAANMGKMSPVTNYVSMSHVTCLQHNHVTCDVSPT